MRSKGKRINYDDNIVIVYNGKEEIYRGLEDYEPLKYEPWRWDDKGKHYKLTINGSKLIKVCIG